MADSMAKTTEAFLKDRLDGTNFLASPHDALVIIGLYAAISNVFSKCKRCEVYDARLRGDFQNVTTNRAA